jgi:hypothetical protein
MEKKKKNSPPICHQNKLPSKLMISLNNQSCQVNKKGLKSLKLDEVF